MPAIIPENATLTTETPGNKLAGQPALGGNVTAIGDAVTQIGDQYEKAALLGETTRAQNTLDLRVGQLTQQAGQDQDLSPERHKYYQDEISKAVNDASLAISLPSAKV